MHTRDQERALHVYHSVAGLEESLRDEYKVMAKDLGANVMRSGLCAALAFIHRNLKGEGDTGVEQGRADKQDQMDRRGRTDKRGRPGKTARPDKAGNEHRRPKPREQAARALLGHLTGALQQTKIPGMAEVGQGEALFATVRGLELDAYMLATREILRLAVWFRRAVDTFEDPPEAP